MLAVGTDSAWVYPDASVPATTSRGDRHLGYSSRHTQVPVPATTPALQRCADLKRCSHNG